MKWVIALEIPVGRTVARVEVTQGVSEDRRRVLGAVSSLIREYMRQGGCRAFAVAIHPSDTCEHEV